MTQCSSTSSGTVTLLVHPDVSPVSMLPEVAAKLSADLAREAGKAWETLDDMLHEKINALGDENSPAHRSCVQKGKDPRQVAQEIRAKRTQLARKMGEAGVGPRRARKPELEPERDLESELG